MIILGRCKNNEGWNPLALTGIDKETKMPTFAEGDPLHCQKAGLVSVIQNETVCEDCWNKWRFECNQKAWTGEPAAFPWLLSLNEVIVLVQQTAGEYSYTVLDSNVAVIVGRILSFETIRTFTVLDYF